MEILNNKKAVNQAKAQNNNQKTNTTQNFKEIKGYKIIEELGKGAFGTVYKVEYNSQVRALKMIHKDLIKRENLQECVNSEIQVMKILNSENCLKIYDNFEYQNWICLVIEYCNEGTLLQYIASNKPNEEQCMKIFIQILNGFKEIHAKKYLHRDLKPENIFIHNGVFKIADFGLAKTQSVGQTQCGSSYYMSPEILQKEQHDHKTDLWSLGVILYFMVFRNFPFKNKSNRLQEIKKACTPEFNLSKHLGQQIFNFNFSKDLENLFKIIFVFNPKERNSFSYIYGHSKIILKYLNQKQGSQYQLIYKDIELDKKPLQDLNTYNTNNSSTAKSDKEKNKILNQNNFGLNNYIIEEDEDTKPEVDQDQDQNLNQNQENLQDEKEENINDQFNEGQISQLNSFNILKSDVQQQLDNDECSIGPKFKVQEVADNFQIVTNCRNDIKKMGDIIINENSNGQQIQTFKKAFQNIYQAYIFNIQKYNFIGDTINLIANLDLPKNTDAVIHFILCKLLVFYAMQLRNSLIKGENMFELKYFDQFLGQKRLKTKLLKKIDADILRWNTRYVMFYYSIDINTMIKNESLKKIITMEVNETDYNQQLKQPTRLVLDSIFKITYSQGMTEYQNFKKEQKEKSENLKKQLQEIQKQKKPEPRSKSNTNNYLGSQDNNNLQLKSNNNINNSNLSNTLQKSNFNNSNLNNNFQKSNINNSNLNNLLTKENNHNLQNEEQQFQQNYDEDDDQDEEENKDDFIDINNENCLKQTPTLKISFCILLCMVINSIFTFQSTKITFATYYNSQSFTNNPNSNKKGFDFWKFYMWIQKASAEQIIESIHTVIKAAYGNQKLISIQNLVQTPENDIKQQQQQQQNQQKQKQNNK